MILLFPPLLMLFNQTFRRVGPRTPSHYPSLISLGTETETATILSQQVKELGVIDQFRLSKRNRTNRSIFWPISRMALFNRQKGVAKLIRQEDMPWGINTYGEIVQFDIVIALSSVVNRVTLGQYDELVAAMATPGIGTHKDIELACEATLYDGESGELIVRSEDGQTMVPVRASYGIARFWQLNHLVHDKRHYTHSSPSKNACVPSKGRTKGGGIRLGEMEMHSMLSGSLHACTE